MLSILQQRCSCGHDMPAPPWSGKWLHNFKLLKKMHNMLLLVVLFAVSRMEGGKVDCVGEDSSCPSHFWACLGTWLWARPTTLHGRGLRLSFQLWELQGGTSPHSPLASALREPRALAEGCFSYDVILIAVQMSLDPTITRLAELLVMIALCPAPR